MKEYYGSQRMRETLSRASGLLEETKQSIINDREENMLEITDEEVHNDVVEVFEGLIMGRKIINQNGTYLAMDDGLDGYSSVEVNVSGGTVIPDPSYLPNSDSTKLLVSQDADDFNAVTKDWGLLKNVIDSTTSIPVKDGNHLHYVPNTFGRYLVGDVSPNQEITVYVVAKSYNTSNNGQRMLTISYAESARNCPAIYTKASTVWTSMYSTGEYSTGVSAIVPFVAALKSTGVDENTVAVKMFVNGTLVRNENIYHIGGHVDINGGGAGNANKDPGTCDYYYLGIVNESESDETIIANMQHLMEVFEIS